MKKKKTKQKTQSQLKKILDKLFSEYVRRKYSDENEEAVCVTCGVRKHWKELQNGHYISRTHTATRYHLKNCHVQCVACNVFMRGRLDEYALFLLKTYGKNILTELNIEKRKIVKDYPYQKEVERYGKLLKSQQ